MAVDELAQAETDRVFLSPRVAAVAVAAACLSVEVELRGVAADHTESPAGRSHGVAVRLKPAAARPHVPHEDCIGAPLARGDEGIGLVAGWGRCGCGTGWCLGRDGFVPARNLWQHMEEEGGGGHEGGVDTGAGGSTWEGP